MNMFYNTQGIGDVLLVQLTMDSFENIEAETKGDITLIKDAHSGKIGAFNLFQASKYVKIDEQGSVVINEELVGQVQEALQQNGVDLTLEIDLSPKFVIGHVTSIEKHPNADKLNVCQVNVGNETIQIVCGAPNVDAGQKVVVAKVGAVMPSGLVIRDAELRGVPSSGMICSAKELALPDAPTEKGILVLEESSEVGLPFTI
jgi:tRNA-binding protein